MTIAFIDDPVMNFLCAEEDKKEYNKIMNMFFGSWLFTEKACIPVIAKNDPD